MFTYFYNETIKRSVSVFGTLFNNITVKKVKADGTVQTSQIVPITYGPKKAFLQRLNQEPALSDNMRTSISLPRLAFEISGFNYDSTRQQNKLLRTNKNTLESDGTNRKFQYAPAPYNIEFSLTAYANSQNDALQIVEQILPYFQPEYTVTMKIIDDMSETRDIPIVLDSVSFEDNYEEGLTTNRIIQYNMTFTMKTYFFGPVYTGGIITQVIERDYIGDNSNAFTTTNINSSGLVKEVKHYEPAFSAVSNTVSNSTTVTFDTAINSSISVNDEVFGTNLSTNPTVSSIAEDRLSIVVSSAVTLDDETTLKFVGSVNPNDTFVVAETVTFYDEGTTSTYSEDLESDA